jgi:ketosteroid isomerase-like protein
MRRNALTACAAIFTAGLAMTATAAVASDIDDVKAAGQAFRVALSAMDGTAMAGVWANKPYVTNIGPGSKAADVGYKDSVTKWITEIVPSRFSELKVQMTSIAAVQVNGNVAWVVGMENASGKSKAGEAVSFDLLVTDIFEKDGDKWLMVSHHAQIPPK